MAKHRNTTKALKLGLAFTFSLFCISQIKCRRGLTSHIEDSGINGQYLMHSMAFDIRISKIIKILEAKVRFQTDEEFLDDWYKAGVFFVNLVRNIHKNDAKKH